MTMVRVDLKMWNKVIRPANSARMFLVLGDVVGDPKTLAVFADDALGHNRMLYCQEHQYVYAADERCLRCKPQTGG